MRLYLSKIGGILRVVIYKKVQDENLLYFQHNNRQDNKKNDCFCQVRKQKKQSQKKLLIKTGLNLIKSNKRERQFLQQIQLNRYSLIKEQQTQQIKIINRKGLLSIIAQSGVIK